MGPLGGLYRMVVCKETCTGHVADLDTGLNLIKAAFVQILSDNPATAEEAAIATVLHGADGLLDLYMWADDFTVAETETSAYVLVIGT